MYMYDWGIVVACAISLIALIATAIIAIPWWVFSKKPMSDHGDELMDDIVFLRGYKKDA